MGRKAEAVSLARLHESRKFMLAAAVSEDFKGFGRRELHQLQVRLGFGRVWGLLNFPARWMADGVAKSESQRTIDIVKLTKVDPSNLAEVERVTLTVTRYVLLLMVTPIQTRATDVKYLAASTIATGARYLCYAISTLIRLAPVSKDKIFDRCDIGTLEKIRQSGKQAGVVERLLELQRRGFWMDVPSLEVLEADAASAATSTITDNVPPHSEVEHGAEVAETTAQQSWVEDATQPKPFSPLPDPFVAELGWRCSWYIKMFEPSLLKCATEIAQKLSSVQPGKSDKLHAFESKQSRVVEKFLEAYEWKYSDGTPIRSLQFEIFSAGAGNRTAFQWPPRNLSHIQQLLSIAQSMHLVVALLSFAGRISEVLSLKREDFIEEGLRGRTAKGRTYKWSKRVNGAERDWPLPEFTEIALNRQREFVHIRGRLRRKRSIKPSLAA